MIEFQEEVDRSLSIMLEGDGSMKVLQVTTESQYSIKYWGLGPGAKYQVTLSFPPSSLTLFPTV